MLLQMVPAEHQTQMGVSGEQGIAPQSGFTSSVVLTPVSSAASNQLLETVSLSAHGACSACLFRIIGRLHCAAHLQCQARCLVRHKGWLPLLCDWVD